ncbi:hypothetical protein [Hoeflea sp.]|jgi:hypothetical protein|uniref:hypothetical protein n=1 Tax=Hoeflea sp. TaxID=1940281 RepID=UPI003A91E3D3
MDVVVLPVLCWLVPGSLPTDVLLQFDRKIQDGPFHGSTLVVGMPPAGMAHNLRNTEHNGVSCVGVDQPGWIDNSIPPMHDSIKRNELTGTINGIE